MTSTPARELAKRGAPQALVDIVRWRREVWADARLRLLAEAGNLPSHRARNFFYRRSGMQLHRSSSIHWKAVLYRPEGIIVGAHCTIGDNVFLDGRDGISIGDNVNLGSHVSVYTRQHDPDDAHFAEVGGPVVIGTYAWVSSHAVVLPGITIGEGAVIAAGAVVTRDIPPYAIAGGVPAVVLRQRSRDLRYKLGYAKRFV